MKIEEFLLHCGWMSRDEFGKVIWPAVVGFNCKMDAHHLLKPILNTSFDSKTPLTDLDGMRPRPFGEVLTEQYPEILRDVLARSGLSSLEEVLECYYRWHACEIQPISSYRQCPGFSSRLYKEEFEKRHVGRWLADSRAFGCKEFIRDGDYVFVPEGSSGLYAGIAVIAFRKNIHLLTSNGALVREIFENSYLQLRLKGLTVLGGHAEIDQNNPSTGSRGFLGFIDSFEKAVADPGATVVISPVSGLLPTVGPFAPTFESERSRFQLLDYVLTEKSNLREIVFIGDWTKHLESHRISYGFPIMNPEAKWRRSFEANHSRISIVTCPPPEVRRALEQSYSPPSDRAIFGGSVGPIAREYGQSAKEFDSMSRHGGFESRFIEAYSTTAKAAKQYKP